MARPQQAGLQTYGTYSVGSIDADTYALLQASPLTDAGATCTGQLGAGSASQCQEVWSSSDLGRILRLQRRWA